MQAHPGRCERQTQAAHNPFQFMGTNPVELVLRGSPNPSGWSRRVEHSHVGRAHQLVSCCRWNVGGAAYDGNVTANGKWSATYVIGGRDEDRRVTQDGRTVLSRGGASLYSPR